jgi:hypothetical protein
MAVPDDVRAAPGRRANLPAWMREPLLHFIVLGTILFAVDSLIAARTDDPHTITVDATVDQRERDLFKEVNGRDPSADELYAVRREWLDDEVLYREGIAMALDKGDPPIRSRVIVKARSMIEASLQPPTADPEILRNWFDRNRAKYDQPATYNFEEAVPSDGISEATLHARVAGLNDRTRPSDAQARLRVFKDQRRDSLVRSEGEQFVGALESMPVGEWRLLNSRSGMRVIRLDSVTPAQPAQFEKLMDTVLPDWIDATMAEQRSAAVRAMVNRYTVKVTRRPAAPVDASHGASGGPGTSGSASAGAVAVSARATE